MSVRRRAQRPNSLC